MNKIRTAVGIAAISVGAALMGHGIVKVIRYGKEVTDKADEIKSTIDELAKIENAEMMRRN